MTSQRKGPPNFKTAEHPCQLNELGLPPAIFHGSVGVSGRAPPLSRVYAPSIVIQNRLRHAPSSAALFF